MDYTRLEVGVENGIGHIRLNRPEKRNALDRTTVDELFDAIAAMGANVDVRAVVLGGNGPAFCAGADLAYLQALSEFSIVDNMEDSAALARTLRSIWELPKPVIARVHGPAIAGGCGLATVCDIVVAVESATFGYTEVGIGFIPAIVTAFLLRKGRQSQTRELLLTGRIISAMEAAERDLVTTVLPDEAALDAHIESLCVSFRKADPTAVSLTKQMLTALDGMSLDASLDYASRMNAAARMTPGCREGIRRFLEKMK